MRFQRRFQTIVFAATMTMLLAACGGGAATTLDEGDTEAADATADELEEELPTTQTEVDAEAVYAELAAMPSDERMAEIVEKAKEEGTVLMYGASPIGYQESWSEAFMEKYPEIQVLFVRAKSNDLAPRLQAEARAGKQLADVIEVPAEIALELRDADLIADHQGVAFPDGLPEEYTEGTWFANTYLIGNVIAWNTDLVSEDEVPETIDELLEENWRGRVVMDVAPQAFVQGLIAERGYEGAEEFLKALFANDAQVRTGHSAITNAQAAGEFDLSIETYTLSIEPLLAQGAPLEYMAPDPTPGHGTGMVIAKGTQRPHAAALYAHFVVGAEGGQLSAENGGIPVHPEAEFTYERLKRFVTPGTPENERFLPITPSRLEEIGTGALDLIDQYVVPNLSE